MTTPSVFKIYPLNRIGSELRPSAYDSLVEYLHSAKETIPSRYQAADHSKIPKKILLSFSELDPKKKEGKNSLYLHGPTGVGKTFVAYCIQLKLASQGRPSAFIETYEFLYQTQNYLFQRPSLYSIEEIKTYPFLLILDDFGMDKMSDLNFTLLTKLIDWRYKHKLPTVLTSNFSLESLANNGFDDRLISRIVEMCEVLAMEGTDKRAT